MKKAKSRAGVGRDLIKAIDEIVGYVKKHEGGDISWQEVTETLHPMGTRIQVLASALDLASRSKPAYNTGADVKHMPGPDASRSLVVFENSTWPGYGHVNHNGERTFFVMPFPGHPWYEEMAALRLKAEQVLAQIGGSVESPPAALQIDRGNPRPPDRLRLAHESYEWVCNERPDLVPQGDTNRYTEEMHCHVKENWPGYNKARPCPPFQTWQRYVREYERLTTGPKNTARVGREGRSVVKRSEI